MAHKDEVEEATTEVLTSKTLWREWHIKTCGGQKETTRLRAWRGNEYEVRRILRETDPNSSDREPFG